MPRGCGVTLELTCNRPQTLENNHYPRVPELYPGEDRYLRLQKKLKSEGKPFDKEAIEDAVRRENEWIQFHIDEEQKKKKEREVDQVRMVREEFHDVAERYLMDATDDDSDRLIVEEQDPVNSIRAIRLKRLYPKKDWNLLFWIQVRMLVSLLPSSHPKAVSVNTGTTGILLEDAQGNPIKSVEQGQDCWTAPSISENFIVSDSTNILLSMGRILKNGWRLEYSPEIPEGEQTLSAQYNVTAASSMVLISPDGEAMARIFYKRNSCCLLGRISVGNDRAQMSEGTRWTGTGHRWTETGHGSGNAGSSTDSRTAVERSVSVRIPSYFSELLDRTPNVKWTIMEDGTPFIVYKGTTFVDPKDAFPGWKYRTTMIGEGGSEWSIVELYSDYSAVRSHNVSIPECHGTSKRICTILLATSGNFFTFCNDFKVVVVGRGPETSFAKPERRIPEELSTPVVPVKIAPGRSEGVLGPTYDGDGNPLSELEMQKSAQKLMSEGKEKVRVEAQPQEPTKEERLAHEATHIPFAHWCEACVEAKSKQDHEKKILKLVRIRLEYRTPSFNWTLCFYKERTRQHWLEFVHGLVCQL